MIWPHIPPWQEKKRGGNLKETLIKNVNLFIVRALFFNPFIFPINFLFGHFLYFLNFKNNPFKWAARVIFILLNNLSFVVCLSRDKLHILLLLNVSAEVFFTEIKLFSTIQFRDKRKRDTFIFTLTFIDINPYKIFQVKESKNYFHWRVNWGFNNQPVPMGGKFIYDWAEIYLRLVQI